MHFVKKIKFFIIMTIIEHFYNTGAHGVTYSYVWGNGRTSCYQLNFAKREQVTLDTLRRRRVRRRVGGGGVLPEPEVCIAHLGVDVHIGGRLTKQAAKLK